MVAQAYPPQLWGSILDSVEGVSVLEAEAYVDWLIESRGKTLVWP